jgi:dTDP-4-amino-4,6-dideoxygalactose transaminase
MVPVLVDVDPVYYGLDPAQMEKAITPRTRAVIPVHLFGQAADMDPILEIARKHGLKVIEDSCETMFANYNGRRVGSLGDIGCFSTYVAHLIITGVGGLNTTNNPDYMVKLRSLLNHGRDSIYISIDDDKDKEGEELHTIIERRFSFISVGHSFRVTEMESALGLAQLADCEPMIASRRRNAALLTEALKPFGNVLQTPAIRPGSEHSFMMYPLLLRGEAKRDLVNFLEDKGVETRDMLPLTNQPVYRKVTGWKEEDYPVARLINTNGFYVGCHQDLSQAQLEYIADCIGRYFAGKHAKKPEGAVLVLVSDPRAGISGADIARLPLGLFSRSFVIDNGLDAEARTALQERGVTLIEGKSDPLDILRDQMESAGEDAAVLFPFNGQWNQDDIPRILMALNLGYDMVIGSRFMMGGGRKAPQGRIRSLGNRIFNLLADIMIDSNLSDSFSTFRGLRLSRLREIKPSGQGLAKFFSLSLEAVSRGWRIQEIPTVEMTRSSRGLIARSLPSVLPALSVLLRQKRTRAKADGRDRR